MVEQMKVRLVKMYEISAKNSANTPFSIHKENGKMKKVC